MLCAVCQKDRKRVEYAPTLNQLVFGGFPVKMQWRCPTCEKQLATQVGRILKDVMGGRLSQHTPKVSK